MARHLGLFATILLLATAAATAEAGLEPGRHAEPPSVEQDPVWLVEAAPAEKALGLPTLNTPTSGLFGNDAGCDATFGGTQWSREGTPNGPCPSNPSYLRFGIHYTALRCLEACGVDVINSGVWFTFLSVDCEPQSLALVDWEQETVTAYNGHCEAWYSSGSGVHPTEFTAWRGSGTDGKWSHTDNLEDALFHLLMPSF